MVESNKIVLIKLKEGATDKIIARLEDSYMKKVTQIYNVVGENDKALMTELLLDKEYWCLFITYEGRSSSPQFRALYWGSFTLNKNRNMVYQIHTKSLSQMICLNIASYVELNLKADFHNYSQINIESSSALVNQMEFIRRDFYEFEPRKITYAPIDTENELSNLAQKNQHCKRLYNMTEIADGRGEFQRDYDRIVHSKAFRRLVDKAQIFTSSKGDYYRTRMTHSLLVNQISKSMCIQLKLNPCLTEAIALGHDLGHTPFGHQGERTLDNILSGEIKSPDNPLNENDYGKFGGFKHNYQSLRIASHLEEAYIAGEGLDLSAQTLEGILKHTELRKECELLDFLPSDLISDMNMDHEFATTLEGQIVAVADEIAQRAHDLDDAFSAKLIDINYLIEALGLKKAKELKNRITNIQNMFKTFSDQGRKFTDKEELLHEKISAEVIDFFVQDVVNESMIKMKNYGALRSSDNRVDEKLIWFSKSGEILCRYLERIISKKVINGLEVSQFDSRGNAVVLGLFRAYYRNPKLLHVGTLRRIYYDMRQQGITELIDFETGDQKLVKKEWNKINGLKLEETAKEDDYNLKRKILVRNICDFIAGMTDTYALSEYNKICF